jgi:hypothetical protein
MHYQKNVLPIQCEKEPKLLIEAEPDGLVLDACGGKAVMICCPTGHRYHHFTIPPLTTHQI